MAERLLLSELFETYRLDFIVFKNQSRKTEENHLICMRAAINFFGDIHIDELSFPMVRDWKTHLSKHRTDATVRNYIIKLRVVLRFAQKRGYKALDPDTIPVPKRVDIVAQYVTAEEVQAMIDSCTTRYTRETECMRSKAIISMLYGSGIRLSELISLDKSQIINGTFTVVGKGGKARLCFIDTRTEVLLGAYLSLRTDNHAALFFSRLGTGRMVSTNIQVTVRAAAKRAGIDRHVTPHTLRHAFATNFIVNNGNVRHLQTLLGHKSLETTAQYAHVTNPDLKKAYDAFHSI